MLPVYARWVFDVGADAEGEGGSVCDVALLVGLVEHKAHGT